MLKWLLSKFKLHDIVKDIDGVNLIYLRRYFILRTPWLKIFLHNIKLPDQDPDPHDHPWPFLSLILKGGYREQRWSPKRQLLKTQNRKRFSIGFRRANAVHKINEVDADTWTLIICGPRSRDWGFLTIDGWIHWRKYLDYWGNADID